MEHQWKALGRMGTTNDWLNPKNMVKIFLDDEYHGKHNKQVHVWNS
jgi:hypothetical protein